MNQRHNPPAAALPPPEQVALAVVGLGRVGLPLAIAFGNRLDTLGYDRQRERIDELRRGIDRHGELLPEEIGTASRLSFASRLFELQSRNVFVVAVSSGEDRSGRPDPASLVTVCKAVGSMLKSGDVVIFETGIYPGGTEEVCLPVLERVANLRLDRDFHCAYATPSLDVHGQPVTKIVAATSPVATAFVQRLYASALSSPVRAAESIRVAEAAHVVNQVLHEVSVAAINELALILDRLGVDAGAAIDAAEAAFRPRMPQPGAATPGRLGIDPFVLPAVGSRAEYQHDLLATARRLNRRMGAVIARRLTRLLNQKGKVVRGARVLLLGITARPDSSVLRGSMAFELIGELHREGIVTDAHDPHAIAPDVEREFGLSLTSHPEPGSYDAVVLVVPHSSFSAPNARTPESYARRDGVFLTTRSLVATTGTGTSRHQRGDAPMENVA